MTRIIDMHTHIAPRQAVKIAESGGTWHGVEFYRDNNDKLTTCLLYTSDAADE